MERDELREHRVDPDLLEDAPTDYLIELAAAKDSKVRAASLELDLIKAELQHRAEQELQDKNVKFTEFFGESNSYVNVSYAQKLEVLNMPKVKSLLPPVAEEKVTVKPAEVKYEFEKGFKAALIAVVTGDYSSEYTVEQIVDSAGWKMDSKQRSLILKKLKGEYAKDRDTIRKALGSMSLDVDVELYLIYKAKNWQAIQAYFPEDEVGGDFEAWAEQLRKYVTVDETPKIELKYG